MLCVFLHDTAEFRFLRGKALPDAFRSLAKVFGKARQRDATLAVVNKVLRVLIARKRGECLAEMM